MSDTHTEYGLGMFAENGPAIPSQYAVAIPSEYGVAVPSEYGLAMLSEDGAAMPSGYGPGMLSGDGAAMPMSLGSAQHNFIIPPTMICVQLHPPLPAWPFLPCTGNATETIKVKQKGQGSARPSGGFWAPSGGIRGIFRS